MIGDPREVNRILCQIVGLAASLKRDDLPTTNRPSMSEPRLRLLRIIDELSEKGVECCLVYVGY